MADTVRDYLRRMGIEEGLHAAMLRVPSGEVRYLPPDDIRSFGLEGDDPAYAEWVKARAIERMGHDQYEVYQSKVRMMSACLSGKARLQCEEVAAQFDAEVEKCASKGSGHVPEWARERGKLTDERPGGKNPFDQFDADRVACALDTERRMSAAYH